MKCTDSVTLKPGAFIWQPCQRIAKLKVVNEKTSVPACVRMRSPQSQSPRKVPRGNNPRQVRIKLRREDTRASSSLVKMMSNIWKPKYNPTFFVVIVGGFLLHSNIRGSRWSKIWLGIPPRSGGNVKCNLRRWENMHDRGNVSVHLLAIETNYH